MFAKKCLAAITSCNIGEENCWQLFANMAEEKAKESGGSSSALKNFLAGGVGGVCLVAAGHPLDTIKVCFSLENSLF